MDGLWAHPLYPSVFATDPLADPFWLTFNVFFDVLLGLIPFIFLVKAYPFIERRATATFFAGIKTNTTTRSYWTFLIKGRIYDRKSPEGTSRTFERQLPRHRHWWEFLMWMRAVGFILLVGVFGDLLLSQGWVNPLSLQGLFYDIVFARANGQPNGAHILSYLGVPLFGIVVAYKFKPKGMMGLFGDTFQGICGAGFLGAVHEAVWIVLSYIAYSKYLVPSVLPEVIRDISFSVLVVLLILTFWKFPGRKMPLKIFKWPIIIYIGFSLAWFFVPALFGYPFLPITTINNPNFGKGLYQATLWLNDPIVNALEVSSWLILWVPFVIQVVRFRK